MDAIMGGRQSVEGWLGDVRRGSVGNMERATAGHHPNPANDPEEAELDQMIKKERKKTVLLKLRMENKVLQRRAHVPSLPPSTELPVPPPFPSGQPPVPPSTAVPGAPLGASPPSTGLPPVAGDPRGAKPPSLELPPVAAKPPVPSPPAAPAAVEREHEVEGSAGAGTNEGGGTELRKPDSDLQRRQCELELLEHENKAREHAVRIAEREMALRSQVHEVDGHEASAKRKRATTCEAGDNSTGTGEKRAADQGAESGAKRTKKKKVREIKDGERAGMLVVLGAIKAAHERARERVKVGGGDAGKYHFFEGASGRKSVFC